MQATYAATPPGARDPEADLELVRAVRAVASGTGYLQAEITRPILARLADGLANKQIARQLAISEAHAVGLALRSHLID